MVVDQEDGQVAKAWLKEGRFRLLHG
jgi:hypothetical protein